MIYINILTILFILGLIAYAAYCDAVMDTISDFDDVHILASIYAKKNQDWYNKRLSWKLKHDRTLWLANLPKSHSWLRHLPFMDSFSDEWHFKKTKKLFCFGLAMILWSLLQINIDQYWVLLPLGIMVGTVWIITFNFFYNYKLKSKQ